MSVCASVCPSALTAVAVVKAAWSAGGSNLNTNTVGDVDGPVPPSSEPPLLLPLYQSKRIVVASGDGASVASTSIRFADWYAKAVTAVIVGAALCAAGAAALRSSAATVAPTP